MPFINIPGIKGQIYIPEANPASVKKHRCLDCVSCQMCNDDKCAICLSQQSPNSRKRSSIPKSKTIAKV